MYCINFILLLIISAIDNQLSFKSINFLNVTYVQAIEEWTLTFSLHSMTWCTKFTWFIGMNNKL